MLNRHSLMPFVGIMALFLSAVSLADTDRGRNWEGTLQLIGTGSESSGGDNGSSLDFDSSTGFAFGFAYNFNPNLSVGFDASLVKPNYSAELNTEDDGVISLRHKANIFNGQLNGTWNMINGPFTPYLQLGIGWTHMDSNVTDGPPTTGCWWDPWWGYVCSNFYSTYKDTRFSWGAGAGLRYEFMNGMFVKGSVNRIEIDSKKSAADPKLDMWKLELGWMMGRRR